MLVARERIIGGEADWKRWIGREEAGGRTFTRGHEWTVVVRVGPWKIAVKGTDRTTTSMSFSVKGETGSSGISNLIELVDFE